MISRSSESVGVPTLSSDTDLALDTVDLPRIQKAWDRLARSLSRRSSLVVAVWLCAVALSFVGYSRQKPLWNDELLFRWIASMPTFGDIWSALKLAINTDPPLAHLLTHALVSVFGSGALIVRLPSMMGVCVMLLCLFLTLRPRVGSLYALLGLTLPFCTTLPAYGYEARPYGLMYGFIGIAVYCWAKVGEDRFGSFSWNIALGCALTATLACHFYSVFALPAFYLGEGVRTLRRRRVSWPTLAAMAVASASVVLYRPIAVSARQLSSAYFEKPSLRSVPLMIDSSLQALVLPLFIFLVLVAIFGTLGFRFTHDSRNNGDDRYSELTALALGFLLLPLLAWGAGVLVLKAFTARYVLHGLFGVFLVLPLFAARVFRLDRSLGLALLVASGLPASLYVARGAADSFIVPHSDANFALLERALPNLAGDIVVSDPHVFTRLVNYSPALKSRCVFLLDREDELRYTGHDGMSLVFANAGRMGWFRTEQWSEYRDRNKAFLFLTVPDSQSDGPGWLRAQMKAGNRYGEVVMRVGRYVIVAAKPI